VYLKKNFLDLTQALTKPFLCLTNETVMCLFKAPQKFVTRFISMHSVLKNVV